MAPRTPARWKVFTLALVAAGLAVASCSPARPAALPPATSVPLPAPTAMVSVTGPAGLTADQAATLQSLEQVDDYPLYTMHYAGGYDHLPPSLAGAAPPASSWACSLFAALGDPQAMVYGRNFDWDHSPALLLFTDPPDGYASVSMVDIAYLGFVGEQARKLLDLPLEERVPLLYAPILPFDGMNEAGLAIGMAAVPGEALPRDPARQTVDSLQVIREVLDHAATADEAVAILGQYNIDWGNGPPIHYLVADRAGWAVLVEFDEGKMVTFPNAEPWHLATNFLRATAGESLAGQCWRYDRLAARLAETQGRLTAAEAMGLLAAVSQEGTQWSIVYGISTGEVGVSMGRQYETIHRWKAFEIKD